VPGTEGRDIRVAHGSAMGLGIYLAINPIVSAGYSPDHKMLACAVILGNCIVGNRATSANNNTYHSNSNHDGSIMVIYTGAQVLPLFIVSYAPTPPGQIQATPVIKVKKNLKKRKK